jgi:hypothetical protein
MDDDGYADDDDFFADDVNVDVLFPKDCTSVNVVFPISIYILHMLIVCVNPLNRSAFVGCRKHISELKDMF